ncbi:MULTISPECIES: hypothetical protein [Bradyrhizobium]|uniref:hypothetical protein n=1 Tax=Bradyrhizobium brasilense TaxID=1419277 RepID=UPI0013016D8E|nr:hypothetical protein [Bradyrhizobium brasilense]
MVSLAAAISGATPIIDDDIPAPIGSEVERIREQSYGSSRDLDCHMIDVGEA